jgi:hypothetical protein
MGVMFRACQIASLILCLTACACVARADEATPHTQAVQATPFDLPNGDYVHAGTGLHFPEFLGSFARLGGYRYDAAGQNVSIAYRWNHERNPVLVSIYVYPGPSEKKLGTTPEQIEQGKSHVLTALVDEITGTVKELYPAAKLLSSRDTSLMRGTKSYTGRVWSFQIPDGPAGKPVLSHVYLFPFYQDSWVLKYRISYPEGNEQTRKIADLLAHVPSTTAATTRP